MTGQEISRLIGDAYNLQRQRNFTASVTAFKDLLKEMQTISSMQENRHLADVYYGLGLGERAIGNATAASDAFEKALVLATDTLEIVLATDGLSNLKNDEDDRFMMLTVMIKQRVAEMGGNV